jgi:hypothetical protein
MDDAAAPLVLIGRCNTCKRPYRYDIPADVVDRLGGLSRTAHIPGVAIGLAGLSGHGCPEPGHSVHVTAGSALKVTYQPDVECGNSCWQAKSTGCTCSCRGRNHGRAHAYAEQLGVGASPQRRPDKPPKAGTVRDGVHYRGVLRDGKAVTWRCEHLHANRDVSTWTNKSARDCAHRELARRNEEARVLAVLAAGPATAPEVAQALGWIGARAWDITELEKLLDSLESRGLATRPGEQRKGHRVFATAGTEA